MFMNEQTQEFEKVLEAYKKDPQFMENIISGLEELQKQRDKGKTEIVKNLVDELMQKNAK